MDKSERNPEENTQNVTNKKSEKKIETMEVKTEETTSVQRTELSINENTLKRKRIETSADYDSDVIILDDDDDEESTDGQQFKRQKNVNLPPLKCDLKEKKNLTNKENESLPESNAVQIINMCITGLVLCLTRFSHHYKSSYHLAQIYFQEKELKVIFNQF